MIHLSDRDRPILTIEVGGETFVIRRVVTGVYKRYGTFATEGGEALRRLAALQERKDNEPEKADEIREQIDEMSAVAEEIGAGREQMEQDCIRMILEGNGHEFDWEWWIDNTDTVERQAFLVECMNKDAKGGGQKKTADSTGADSVSSSGGTGPT